ncbi:MAG TPA: tripartite tricarboxylate transporter substrate-binding protein [Alphaproteobacteria bacterium]|nr:tripartite tricarboxylate transporter substrate-binding protein [Alphaproteobacteria bacterium]
MIRTLTALSSAALGALALAILPTQSFGADDLAKFYKTKGLRMVVGSGAGGGYDTYTRAFARYYYKFIPGQPRIVVQNMPGASGLLATNFAYNRAPRDGSWMMATYNALIDENLLGNRKAKFEIPKFSWIGSIGKTHHLCVTWKARSKITNIKQLVGKEATVSATGRSGNSATVPLLLNQTVGTKFKVIAGYSTTGSRMALERGEVDAICGLGYSTLQASNPDWFTNKKINIIAQIALNRHANYPDVPNAMDLVSDRDKKVYEFFGIVQEMGRPYIAPPAIPEANLKALRTAFNKTMKDKGFLAEMKKLRLSVNPMTGEEMVASIKKIYAADQSTLNRVAELLGVAKAERVLACKKIAKDPSVCRKRKKKKSAKK